MPRPIVLPSIKGGVELRRTAAVLLEAGRKDLVRGVGRAVKAEAQPTLKDLKQSARQVRIVGERTAAKRRWRGWSSTEKHLRARMADATVVEFRANQNEARVSFHVVGARMGGAPTTRNIPAYIDNGERAGRGGWRHPIMGKRKGSWAVSKGEPWFFPPIKEHLPEFRDRISVVLDEIVAKVEAS